MKYAQTRKQIQKWVSFASVGLMMSGCIAGQNQQFFDVASAADGSAAGPTATGGSNPVDSGTPAPVASATPVASPTSTPNSDICVQNPDAAACNETPAVSTPGAVTILFTMSQIPQSAGSLILANAIKYASPVSSPKILFVKDSATHGEDEGDPTYIKNTLLAGYNVTYGEILPGGLDLSDTSSYDLVIVSNPGYPLSDAKTLATLMSFQGGVILIGDDMSQGDGFDTSALTGLVFHNNGTSMSCNGQSYNYDNENGYQYQVAMNEEFLPGIPAADQNYQYGNDLDWTTVKDSSVQVLATASAAPGTCDIGNVPAVVRHER